MPVGSVIAFAGPLAPSGQGQNVIEAGGWMLCDGRKLQIAHYPELFSILGHYYDDAKDVECFGIPDYRGYFLRGVDSAAKVDQDAGTRQVNGSGGPMEVGSQQADAMQMHKHLYKMAGTPAVASPSGPASAAAATEALSDSGPTDSLNAPGNVRVSAHETRPANIYVHYLIRFSARLYHRRHHHG
jgi:microcystin-dependent protein